MKAWSRREFLRTAGIGGAALLVSGGTPFTNLAWAEKTRYRGVTYITRAYRAIMYGIDGFVFRLRNGSSDLLNVEFFDSAALMTADQQAMGLKSGTADFAFQPTSYLTASHPILGVLGLPGVVQDLYLHGERIAMDSPLWRLINDELAKSNLFMLSAGGGILEPQYIWSSRQKVAGLADLEGKRCRVVSREASEVLKSFGVTPVRIPSAECYLALQRGRVDALVANVSTIIGRSLYKQLRYCYQMPVTAFAIAVFFLKERWDEMPARDRAAFIEAAQWYDRNSAETINKKIYPEEYWPLVEKSGIAVSKPSKGEEKEFYDRARPAWTWWEKEVGEEKGSKAILLAMGTAGN